ncbi:hypothetical protein STEG23_000042, partial [Scotinomys teguina]
ILVVRNGTEKSDVAMVQADSEMHVSETSATANQKYSCENTNGENRSEGKME